mmetsp:Transcript_49151/g.143082  ORF Transcript_49151/g.143082 Transcript_49151/m.143082 type:complete len:202 (+) Transcript_49151:251-856(+)
MGLALPRPHGSVVAVDGHPRPRLVAGVVPAEDLVDAVGEARAAGFVQLHSTVAVPSSDGCLEEAVLHLVATGLVAVVRMSDLRLHRAHLPALLVRMCFLVVPPRARARLAGDGLPDGLPLLFLVHHLRALLRGVAGHRRAGHICALLERGQQAAARLCLLLRVPAPRRHHAEPTLLRHRCLLVVGEHRLPRPERFEAPELG